MGDPDRVERFYGRWAGLYDLLATRFPGIASARRRAVESLELSPGETVVEMGCGTGANLPYLRDAVGAPGRVVGVDRTPGMLERARGRIERAGWENVHVVRGDAADPPVVAADAVLGAFVVGMFEDPAAVVDGWFDLLGPGDRIALLDAAPRGRPGPLDAAFRLFVALSTPPTWRLRYESSPARALEDAVEASRRTLRTRGDLVVEERSWRSLLRLAAARKAGD